MPRRPTSRTELCTRLAGIEAALAESKAMHIDPGDQAEASIQGEKRRVYSEQILVLRNSIAAHDEAAAALEEEALRRRWTREIGLCLDAIGDFMASVSSPPSRGAPRTDRHRRPSPAPWCAAHGPRTPGTGARRPRRRPPRPR